MNWDQFHRRVRLKSYLLLLALLACSPEPAPTADPETPATIAASPTAVQAPTEPPESPTAAPPVASSPTAAAEPSCPEPAEGTRLLTREEMGYCLLYSEGYLEIDTEPAQVCLVPEGPTMACHTANAFVNIEEAAGHSASQIVDEIVADAEAEIPDIAIERSSLIVSGEEAVKLEGLPGVASSRTIFVVHADRLYRLTFVPWDEGGEEFGRLETLYNTVINSFTFVPLTALPPTPTAPAGSRTSPGSGGSAVVVFIHEGGLMAWEESTGESRTLFDTGDAIRVGLSDDGLLVAFVRRSYFETGGFERNEQSALSVVELVPAGRKPAAASIRLSPPRTAVIVDPCPLPQKS